MDKQAFEKKVRERFKGERNVWIMQGLPASRKSSAVRSMTTGLTSFGKIGLSLDEIRKDLYGSEEIQGNIQEVLEEAKKKFLEYFMRYKVIVIDITCSQRLEYDFWVNYVNSLIEGTKLKVRFELIRMPLDLEFALQSNRERAKKGGRFVPEDIIHLMHQRLLAFDYSGIAVTDWKY